jgi:hypothetical protein
MLETNGSSAPPNKFSASSEMLAPSFLSQANRELTDGWAALRHGQGCCICLLHPDKFPVRASYATYTFLNLDLQCNIHHNRWAISFANVFA